MPSVGFLLASPFLFSFTHVGEEEKLLVNLFSFALVPEANPSMMRYNRMEIYTSLEGLSDISALAASLLGPNAI